MAIKIDKKIVSYNVGSPKSSELAAQEEGVTKDVPQKAEIIRMHEKLERVTINDIILNAGTEHEQRRPFEIFINSKNMDHFQWIVALTRVMSAVFRKGGDVTFLSEELQAVFDPKGGYFKPGGRFVPSIVADIGAVVEHHLRRIGLLEPDELSEQQLLMLEQKRAEVEAREREAAEQAGSSAEKKTPLYAQSATPKRWCF